MAARNVTLSVSAECESGGAEEGGIADVPS